MKDLTLAHESTGTLRKLSQFIWFQPYEANIMMPSLAIMFLLFQHLPRNFHVSFCYFPLLS